MNFTISNHFFSFYNEAVNAQPDYDETHSLINHFNFYSQFLESRDALIDALKFTADKPIPNCLTIKGDDSGIQDLFDRIYQTPLGQCMVDELLKKMPQISVEIGTDEDRYDRKTQTIHLKRPILNEFMVCVDSENRVHFSKFSPFRIFVHEMAHMVEDVCLDKPLFDAELKIFPNTCTNIHEVFAIYCANTIVNNQNEIRLTHCDAVKFINDYDFLLHHIDPQLIDTLTDIRGLKVDHIVKKYADNFVLGCKYEHDAIEFFLTQDPNTAITLLKSYLRWNTKIVRRLMAKGGVSLDNVPLIKHLSQHKPELIDKLYDEPLYTLFDLSATDTLRKLDIDFEDTDSLHYVCQHTKSLEVLAYLDNLCDVNSVNDDGLTPLQLALNRDDPISLDFARHLILQKAQYNTLSEDHLIKILNLLVKEKIEGYSDIIYERAKHGSVSFQLNILEKLRTNRLFDPVAETLCRNITLNLISIDMIEGAIERGEKSVINTVLMTPHVIKSSLSLTDSDILFYGIKGGTPFSVGLFLKDHLESIDTPNEEGLTPLGLATQLGKGEVVNVLNAFHNLKEEGHTSKDSATLSGREKALNVLDDALDNG